MLYRAKKIFVQIKELQIAVLNNKNDFKKTEKVLLFYIWS